MLAVLPMFFREILNLAFLGSFRRRNQTRNIFWHDTQRYSIRSSAGFTVAVTNRIIRGPDTWNVAHNAFEGALHNICRNVHFTFLWKNSVDS